MVFVSFDQFDIFFLYSFPFLLSFKEKRWTIGYIKRREKEKQADAIFFLEI